MPKHIKIFQIDAFTSEPFKGNPTAVVFDNALSEDQMKNIAAEMNLSETAFLSDSELADFNLRWFTPKSEVKLCGHATIASLHYLYENNILKENSTVTFNTKSGIIEAGRNNFSYWMKLPIVNFSIVENSLTELYSALGLNSEQIKMILILDRMDTFLFVLIILQRYLILILTLTGFQKFFYHKIIFRTLPFTHCKQ